MHTRSSQRSPPTYHQNGVGHSKSTKDKKHVFSIENIQSSSEVDIRDFRLWTCINPRTAYNVLSRDLSKRGTMGKGNFQGPIVAVGWVAMIVQSVDEGLRMLERRFFFFFFFSILPSQQTVTYSKKGVLLQNRL